MSTRLARPARQPGWLLVDWPPPWPPHAAAATALSPVLDAVQGTGIRVQLVVPDGGRLRQVVLHRSPPGAGGWSTSYERIFRQVHPAAVVDAAM